MVSPSVNNITPTAAAAAASGTHIVNQSGMILNQTTVSAVNDSVQSAQPPTTQVLVASNASVSKFTYYPSYIFFVLTFV